MTRGRRALVQLALLPILYMASLSNPAGFGVAVGALLLLPPVLCGTVASILIWTSRQAPEVATLRERADDAFTLFLQSLGAAGVGVIAILSAAQITIPGRPALAILAWVLLLIVVPAIGWLGTWRNYWLPLIRGEEPEGPAPG